MMQRIIHCLSAVLCFGHLAHRESLALSFDRLSESQAVTDSAGGSATSSLAAGSSMIGGFRTLRTQTTSAGGFVTAIIDQGVVEHSQSASQGGALGLAVLTWDGDSDPNTTNFSGLGGVNLVEDGATGLRIGVQFTDSPGEQASIRIRLYDASDAFGDTYSEYAFTLTGGGGQAFTKDVQFSSPVAVGALGPTNITNIGAITLTIDGRVQGAGAADIVLNFIGTNGNCDRIPVDGTALDTCGVCGGDNTTCLDCQSVDIKDLLQRLDNGAKVQEDVVKRSLRVLRKYNKDAATRRFSRQTAKRAHRLQLTNWQRTWFISTTVLVCQNTTICSQVDTGSAAVMEAYRSDALKLHDLVPDVLARVGRVTKVAAKLADEADATYQKYYDMSFQVPTTTSVCDSSTAGN